MRPIWLVKKQGNLAVFPRSRSGRFEGHLIQPGDVYEVKGHCEGSNGGSSPQASTSAVQSASASFGAYAMPTYTPPPPHPPVVSRKKTWRKTIVLVSVKKSVKGKEKSGAVYYDIITQVVVNLSPATCNVREVSQLVAKQVDFEVVLLDSKGYPLLDNNSTSGESFWKSTRKILAANKQLYRKVTGQNTNIERASIDLTKDDSSDDSDILLPPVKLRKCEFGDSSVVLIADKIEDISKQVSGLAESITFIQNMQHSLECVVCKGLVRSPIVSKCCGRVIGCKRCVKRWLDIHATCPHCSSVIDKNFPFKGFDDVICLQFAMDEKLPTPRGYESLSSSEASGLN